MERSPPDIGRSNVSQFLAPVSPPSTAGAVLVTEGIVDSLSQALLEGRPSGSLLLTPQQLQQLQRFQVAQEQAGGALTLTLQQGGSGVAPQLVLAPQGFLTAGGGSGQPTAEHILHTSQQIGHTSIQHVLQSSISHVRQASILQSSLQLPATHTSQVTNTGELRNCSDKAVGSPVTSVGTPTSPFSPRSLTPSPSPTQRVVTPQPPVLQLFHQQATTRNAVQNSVAAQAAIKAKQPPQILPKPPGSGGSLTTSNTVTKSAQTVAPQQNQIPQQGTLLLNQVLPNGAVLVQQQTSSGVQLILKSPPPQSQGKPGLVLANGGIQPQAVIVQGRTQAHQVLRFVPSQVQLQQIQTSSGPTIIAVPSPAPPRTATPSQPSPLTLAQKKIKKKKKKEDEPTRLDLANLIKISGIDEEDVSPVVVQGQASTQNKTTSTSPRPSTPKQQLQQAQIQQHTIQQQQQLQQQVQHNQLQSQIQKQINPSQLLAQLQTPTQVGGGLRLSVGEDGTMVVHQAEQPTVTPSIAAAAQSQLAQLIAEHGGQILQTNASLAANNTTKETAFMQSLQTAVLHLAGSGPEGVVLKGNLNQAPVVVNTTGSGGLRRTPVVVTPTIQQNGVRLVADLNGHLQQASTASLTEHNRLIVSGIAPAVLEQNRVQIVTGVPTSTALSLEQQQNRIIVSTGTPNAMLAQQGRVLVSTGSLEQHQNRVQIVTSTNSAVSLTEQNRVIVSNVPNNMSLDQQNRLQILSGVPNSNMSLTEQNRLQIVSGIQNSLTEQQNRVIVSGVQSNMSLEQQNRVQILSGGQSAGTMALEQNRVQIMSGVQSSLTEQQNRLQIVSGVPNSNTLSLSEQNRVHIVSNMPNANTLSLSEKQNLVQIVNSNISLSEEQNRLQIVTSVPTSTLGDQNRLHFVNSIPSSNSISLSEQNRVQLVANVSNMGNMASVPVSASFPFSDQNHVHIVTSLPSSQHEQNKIHFSSLNSNSINLHDSNQRLQIVTSLPNTINIADHNKVQVVTSLPTSNSMFHDSRNKVHIVTSTTANSGDLKQKNLLSGYHGEEHSNVQVVSALVNNEKLLNSTNENNVRSSSNNYKFQQYVKPSEVRLTPQLIHQQKDKETIKNEEREDVKLSSSSDNHLIQTEVPSRLQYVSSGEDGRVQIVGANNHTSVIAALNQVRNQLHNQQQQQQQLQHHMQQQQQQPPQQIVYAQPQETSPKMAKSPAQFISPSPINSPPPTAFNNRPNLTVVTQPQRHEQTHVNSVQTNVMSTQVNTITKVDSNTTPVKTTQANRRTYDNAFLDSIAQAHPNLVINKSPTAISCAKVMKVKKPVKKAALVKPMMAEDRTVMEKEDPPNLIPINVTTDHVPPVVSRVQTVQLTPLKQQQLKQIQAQVTALSGNKTRSPTEQATLQRLISEQHKILLGGKLIPTVPGQHAQGLAFVNPGGGTSVRLLPVSTPSRVSNSTQSEAPSPTQSTPPQPVLSSPQHSQPSPPVVTHANKATSPIPLQQQVSTQTPLPPPPQPIFSRAKRASMIEQQMQADRQGALVPDTTTPFLSKSDAVKRLIRYHTMNEPVLSEKDLDKADELFEQTAKHLLDKKTNMYNKFSFLILKESMRLQKTSELVLLERLFVNDETARLEQIKEEANLFAASSTNTTTITTTTTTLTTMTTSSSTTTCSQSSMNVKRERDEFENGDSKKHCPDDEEINAQVQCAIDSILNLQRTEPLDDISVKNS